MYGGKTCQVQQKRKTRIFLTKINRVLVNSETSNLAAGRRWTDPRYPTSKLLEMNDQTTCCSFVIIGSQTHLLFLIQKKKINVNQVGFFRVLSGF